MIDWPRLVREMSLQTTRCSPYYVEAIMDAETNAELLCCRILADLPASLIHRLTQAIGRHVPVRPPSVRFELASTILEWPIVPRLGSASSAKASPDDTASTSSTVPKNSPSQERTARR